MSNQRTVEEHIEILKSYHHGFTGCAGNLQDSIDVAVDIMSKYQKIENDLKACEQDNMKFISVRFLKEIIDGSN